MATITFDITLFRDQFPQFANEIAYPDAKLQSFFDVATCYVSDCDSGRLTGDCRLRALNLMTAHLVVISDLAVEGKTPKFVTSAKIGSVTTSVQPPPQTDQWQWWLNLTPYGMQLLALLQSSSIGGFYIGGLPEKAAFRKVGGVF